jgi:ligand-binding sensor domain-containing protein/AraC-like DNA-binding protein
MKSFYRHIVAILVMLLIGVNSSAEEHRAFQVYNAANGLSDNSAQTITCTKTGRLVITTMGQINFFDGQQFSYIDPTSENLYPLPNYSGNDHLYFDKYHHLWLKNTHTVTCVNLIKETFVDNIVDEFHNLGMDDKVTDLFVDQQNYVWMLTAKGIFCSQNKKYYQVRQRQNLQDLMTYEDKNLLLFYENGEVDIYDLDSDKPKATYAAYDQEQKEKYASSSVVCQVGDIFYQIRNGSQGAILLSFDFNKKSWKTIMNTSYYLSNLKEKDSTLYVSCAYGYWTYDLVTEKLTHIEELTLATGQKLLTDINTIEFDRQGGMWVGTQMRGLLYARPFLQPFRAYSWTEPRAMELFQKLEQRTKEITSYRDRTVNCVYRDSRGWDWVGTSSGLQLYKSKKDQLPQLFTRKDGLLNNVIHCIIEDNLHNIWVGTSYGVCCLLIKDEKVDHINRYNEWDGVPKESFVNGRSMRLPGGEIVMQALDHVVTFMPDSMVTIKDHLPFVIYPKLIRLFVNGNDVKPGQNLDGNVILEKALPRTKEINLNYNQNSISLTFSGLNYFRPQQTYYRVRVTGPDMDERWKTFTPYNSQGLVDSRGQLHLPLSSLRPGTYYIEVQASMLLDNWDTTPYEWTVKVNEPWWRTTGIMMILGFLLLAMFLYYVYLYIKNANLRARRNAEEQGIIRRIKTFADRCDASKGIFLEPLTEETALQEFMMSKEFSPLFVQTMITILPTVSEKKIKDMTMNELSIAANMPTKEFYELMTSNIYKNPRPIVMEVMLNRAKAMLEKDKNKNLAEVARECGFSTPNYFIASFYRKYRKTPKEFVI